MKFNINSAEYLNVTDQELSLLLTQVFVLDGFTDPKAAKSLFNANAVRCRGQIYAARDIKDSTLAGIVINVSMESESSHFAKPYEIEMHLLAVSSEFRRNGLGKLLVEKAISHAIQDGYSKMILWTQTSMKAAHALYESCGFVHITERDFSKNNRNFWIYERILNI